ncbi:MAG TPA: hypothetical protein VHR65_03595 [Solirubrobacterales bacterium]|nr:hypothetical protein [Solirubrobacterales bacterium]
MRLIKMFGLAALAALMAMALVGASSAMAESTALCKEDAVLLSGEICPSGKLITHVHETTVAGAKAKLLSTITVECDVLFLGDVTSANSLGAPLVISGNFTYTNCGSCEVEERSEHSTIEVLKLGHELADVTGEGKVFVDCGSFLECEYDGERLIGHALGPLLSTHANGDVTLEEQVTHKTGGGFFCPAEAKLDILTTPLVATYIAK